MILISPGATLTYASVKVVPRPSAQPSGSELVSLSVTVPSGIYFRFVGGNPVNVSLDSQLSLQGSEPPSAHFALSAAQDVAPGDYQVTVLGTSGSLSETNSFTVRVAQYLVIAKDNHYSPANLTGKVGSTVYWLNLGVTYSGDDPEEFDVVFLQGGGKSPRLLPAPFYDSFSHTFTSPGTFVYYCSQPNSFPFMIGEVKVTSRRE
jgi:plastocyanin